MKNNISFQEAFKVFTKTLREDKELYQSYKDNIAMAFKDEYINWLQSEYGPSDDLSLPRELHWIANNAASNFLDLLIRE